MDESKRYWGIWVGGDDGRFMRWSSGPFIYYPSPGIAQAHADEMRKDLGLKLHEPDGRFEVREFLSEETYKEVNG